MDTETGLCAKKRKLDQHTDSSQNSNSYDQSQILSIVIDGELECPTNQDLGSLEDKGQLSAMTNINQTDDIKSNSDINASDECGLKAPTVSKKQQKRIQRQEQFLEKRVLKRKEWRKRRKEKKKDARARGEDLGPSRKSLKHKTMEKSTCKLQVAIDCSFDDLMTDKDVAMLVKQIQRCYAVNRRAEEPLQFYLTSLGCKTLEKMKSIGDYNSWDIYYKTENYIQIFGKENVVYLSSESDNVLLELDETKTYIIGGLVDHNHHKNKCFLKLQHSGHVLVVYSDLCMKCLKFNYAYYNHKGLCHKLAEEKGIVHAQLPIGEFLEMKTRKVLAINHVYEIILRFMENKNWRNSFFEVIPQRKQAIAKLINNDTDLGQDQRHNDLHTQVTNEQKSECDSNSLD